MKNQYENENYLTKKEIIIYGISNGGQVFGYSLVSSYLMYFYINVFAIDAKIISVIFLIGGIWDIINNPLIGTIIDHKSNKQNKLTSIIKRFTPVQAAATVLIFMGPLFIKSSSLTSPAKIIYLLLTYFLWEFFYSVTDVSFGGLAAVISPNPIERQKAISAANICVQLSGSLVFVILPFIIDLSKSEKYGISLADTFLYTGVAAGTIGVGLFSLSGYFVKERITQNKPRQSIRELLLSVAHNRPMLIMLASNLISSFSGIGEAFATYYYLDVLGYASLSILTSTPAFIISMFSYSLIGIAKKHFSNKTILIFGILIASASQFILFLIGLKDYANPKIMIPSIIICNCIIGIFGGILNVLPTEMLTEAADYSEWKTGIRTEGIAFSLKNSVVKIYGTIAQGLAAFLLSIIGYISATSCEAVIQNNDVQRKIWIIFSLTPAIVRFISALPLFFYDIVGEERRKMFYELKIMRENRNLPMP